MFSARFDKQYEDDQVSDDIELVFKLKISQSLTESGVDNTDSRSHLEKQRQRLEMRDIS